MGLAGDSEEEDERNGGDWGWGRRDWLTGSLSMVHQPGQAGLEVGSGLESTFDSALDSVGAGAVADSGFDSGAGSGAGVSGNEESSEDRPSSNSRGLSRDGS